MEKILDDYLAKMEKYLKPVSASERIDIIKEIKSEMQELENNQVPAEKIVERLGSPKDLAKSYLGNLLTKESKFSWNRFLVVCAFYSLVGFSGMFVIPCLGVIAPSFLVIGVLTPVAGAVKLIDYIFKLHLPYVENIQIVLGGLLVMNPVIEFVISLIVGVLMCLAGRAVWRLLVLYCKKVGKAADKFSIRKENCI